ncbi:MAG: prepilin-type N-terminal cleavage/methylation domain-containing protein [Stellaceae bacterium]
MARNAATGRQSGFTLLEMLVVVVVLGLLVVGLTQGVRAALSLWSAQQRRLGETAELDDSARLLRTLMTGIAAAPADGSAGAAAEAIKGESDQLSFVGDLPTGLGATRRADITIALHGHRLVLSWAPHLHELSVAPPPPPVETELIRGVAHVDFAYWGAAAPDQPAAWLSQWDQAAAPALIRVRLVFEKGDRRRWPDLIVAPEL